MSKKVLFFGLVLLLISCTSTRDFYNKRGELKNISDVRLLRSIEENYNNYNTLFLKKFKAEVTFEGESKSFKGNIFVTKDSSIVISINPLMGIELFRVKLSKSNVEILDRTKREYLVGNYDFLWEKFMMDVDFNIVQGIIMNELFAYPLETNPGDALKRYKHTIAKDLYVFQSIKDGRSQRLERKGIRKDLVLHEFYVMPEIFKINRTYIKDFDTNGQVDILYDNFFETSKGLFPASLKIKGTRNMSSFEIQIDFDDLEFDGTNSIGFKVSSKYKQKELK